MAEREILPGLYFLERGYLNGNHFACRAARPVLIDTAYKTGLPETERRLTALGIDLDRLGLILCTHCHCDHVGGNRVLQERSGCEVALHRVGRHFVDTRDAWATWWDYFDQEADFFRCGRSLEDGETVPVGPHEFRVIHTPGHAADGIVLYHPEEKLLLSGDALWERDVPLINPRVEGSAAALHHLDSLERLASLEVRVVFPGHGTPFTDFRGALARARTRTRAYARDGERLGEDLLKKIVVYTVLMRGAVPRASFLARLMETHWYPETVDRYFASAYEETFRDTLAGLRERGILFVEDDAVRTTVRP